MTDRGQIHLVYGSHGEYSDYQEWNVAAFTNELRATIFKDLVQRKYNEARAQYKLAEDAWEDPEKDGSRPSQLCDSGRSPGPYR